MKHYFVINPSAGSRSAEPFLRERLRAYDGRIDKDIYITKGPGDASRFIRVCRARNEGHLRFYACGGDGTLNELVNGAYGLKDISVASYPCGSGNDYVKYYGGEAAFLDIDSQLAGEPEQVDLMEAGGRLAINMVHFGLDSTVAQTMHRVRRLPVLGGKNAYYTGVISALLQPLGCRCTVWADGERLNGDKLLLCTIGNGQYVGGGYRAAPRSDNADGLLEVCLVKPLPRLRLLGLMSAYKRGTHLDDPRLSRELVYRRAQHLRVKPDKGFVLLLDGELHSYEEADIRVLPRALSFVVPKGAKRIR